MQKLKLFRFDSANSKAKIIQLSAIRQQRKQAFPLGVINDSQAEFASEC